MIVLFTGPAAVGKSTIGLKWATGRVHPTGFVDHDEMRMLVKSGYVSRTEVSRDPSRRGEADTQWLLAASICTAIGSVLASSNFDLSVAAFRPPEDWRGCWQQFDELNPVVVVLTASLAERMSRNRKREGAKRTLESAVEDTARYDWMKWQAHPRALLLDTTEHTPESAIGAIDLFLRTLFPDKQLDRT